MKKENYTPITFINIEATILPTIFEDTIPLMYKKRIIYPLFEGLNIIIQSWLNICKLIGIGVCMR